MTRLWAPATGVRRDPTALPPRSPIAICSRFVTENRRPASLDPGICLNVSVDIVRYSDARNRSKLDFRLCDKQIYTPECPNN